MAFTVPSFPLLCSYGLSPVAGWPGAIAGLVFRVVNKPCNLSSGRRVIAPGLEVFAGNGYPYSGMVLLLPKLTDIRGFNSFLGNGNKCDVVECPQGSGRWYDVGWVDDTGKGFPNEFRFAMLHPKISTWPVPYP